MSILIKNTLSGEKEVLTPIEPGKIKIYACGITPQSSSHIGHAASAIRFATIRKYLEHRGYSVTFVENITDIDDKIIQKSKELNKPVGEIAEENYTEYRNLLTTMGIPEPTFTPKATEYIEKTIQYIQGLIDLEFAYVAENGDVYFDISKKENYYKLSKRKQEDNLSGTRVALKGNKKNDADFSLWKTTDDENGSFASPWGQGRPGWHIECSTMANDLLGKSIDIHCGGIDLLFPHHENEIAQSEALNGQDYANYWIHSGLLTINGEKMSKSLNNFITLKDGLNIYGTEIFVWAVLKHNYRSDINISDKLFSDNLNIILNFYNAFNQFSNFYTLDSGGTEKAIINEFDEIMDNDFNTPKAISLLLRHLDDVRLSTTKDMTEKRRVLNTLYTLGKILGLFTVNSYLEAIKQLLNYQSYNLKLDVPITLSEIDDAIEKVRESRESGNYESADTQRDTLASRGIHLKYEEPGEYSWNFILKNS